MAAKGNHLNPEDDPRMDDFWDSARVLGQGPATMAWMIGFQTGLEFALKFEDEASEFRALLERTLLTLQPIAIQRQMLPDPEVYYKGLRRPDPEDMPVAPDISRMN